MSSNRSKNNRKYSPVAMESICLLSDGAKVFLDHPSPQLIKSGQVRSIRDFAGIFSSPKLSNNQIKATLHATESHFPLFRDLVRMQAPCGMSINATVMVEKMNREKNHLSPIVRKFIQSIVCLAQLCQEV